MSEMADEQAPVSVVEGQHWASKSEPSRTAVVVYVDPDSGVARLVMQGAPGEAESLYVTYVTNLQENFNLLTEAEVAEE
jgi:hypothetical protein